MPAFEAVVGGSNPSGDTKKRFERERYHKKRRFSRGIRQLTDEIALVSKSLDVHQSDARPPKNIFSLFLNNINTYETIVI